MKHVYLEAALIGLCIGLAALALKSFLGGAYWLAQATGFIVAGGLLCALQYWIGRRPPRKL